MQSKDECKNMENNIAIFSFLKENESLELELDTPDFSDFAKKIIMNNYDVSKENLNVSLKYSNKNNIDIEILKSIVVEIHQSFFKEIEEFYKNIETDINTYYSDDEELTNAIKEYIVSISENGIKKADLNSLED